MADDPKPKMTTHPAASLHGQTPPQPAAGTSVPIPTVPVPVAPVPSPPTSPVQDDENDFTNPMLGDLLGLFEQRHNALETRRNGAVPDLELPSPSPITIPPIIEALSVDASIPLVTEPIPLPPPPGQPIPSPSPAATDIPSSPPSPPSSVLDVDGVQVTPEVARELLGLAATLQQLTPAQTQQISAILSGQASILPPVSSTPTPSSPSVPLFAPSPIPDDDWMDERARAAFTAQQTELERQRTIIESLSARQLTDYQSRIAAHATRAETDFASRYQLSPDEMHLVTAAAAQYNLIAPFAPPQSSPDSAWYDAATRTLEQAFWLVPSARERYLASSQQAAVDTATAQQAEITAKRALTGAVSAQPGSIPRTTTPPSSDTRSMTKAQRADAAAAFIGERIGLSSN